MPDTPIRLTITDVDESTIAVTGEIDAHTAPELKGRLAAFVVGDADFVVDMSGVDFVDSSGLRVLIEANQRVADASGRLVLRAPSPSVIRLIEITGLADHLHVTP